MKQSHDPIMKSTWEATPLQELENVFPPHRVDSIAHVKLEEQSRCVAPVKPPDEIPHVHEIIMNASPLYESNLGFGNEPVHVWPKFQEEASLQ